MKAVLISLCISSLSLYKIDDDNDLALGKNASIPEKSLKPKHFPTTRGGYRKKSILKSSKNYDRSSSDEILPRNNYFLDRGNFHLEAGSEISEVMTETFLFFIILLDRKSNEYNEQNRRHHCKGRKLTSRKHTPKPNPY